jgi:hypothetical protein
MQMRQAPRALVEPDVILDGWIGPQRRRCEALEPERLKNPLQLQLVAAIDQDIQVGKPGGCGGKVLVADEAAVTTVLVARAKFLSSHIDVVRRFVTAPAHRCRLTVSRQGADKVVRSRLSTSQNVERQDLMPFD